MTKKIRIVINYEESNEDVGKLVNQEIKETIDGLRNSLLSQVGGLNITITES